MMKIYNDLKIFQIIALSFFIFTGRELAIADDFPDHIYLKTPRESFTHKYYFVLHKGKIWFKANEEMTGIKEDWRLLGGHGLPGKPAKGSDPGKPFDDLSSVKAISIDGRNIIAIGENNNFCYYAKLTDLEWKKDFFAIYDIIPFISSPLVMPKNNRAWAISHRKDIMVYYEDIKGNKHPMGSGVTTIYMLSEDGNHILYSDPWVAKSFEHRAPMPWRGKYIAKNMSVSSSTIFLINEIGDMYTRLYDFDVAGDNYLPEEFIEGGRKIGRSVYKIYRMEKAEGIYKKVRFCPALPWKKHKRIQGSILDENGNTVQVGKLMSTITVLQVDKGNCGAELRVLGTDNKGNSGYYTQRICDEEDNDPENDNWIFIRRDIDLTGHDFLIDPKSKSAALDNLELQTKEKTYEFKKGRIYRYFVSEEVKAKLIDFSVELDDAIIRMEIDGSVFNCELYMKRFSHHETWFTNKQYIKAYGTIFISDSIINSNNENVQRVWKNLFKKMKKIDLILEIYEDSVNAKQDLHLFGLPEIVDNYFFIRENREVERSFPSNLYNIKDVGILHPYIGFRLKLEFSR